MMRASSTRSRVGMIIRDSPVLREGQGPPRAGPGGRAIPPREQGLAANFDQRLAPAAPDTGHAGHGARQCHPEAHD
jgi:hypothetical protein